MLTVTIPSSELWNEKLQEFVVIKEQKLVLEHSLISLSKWEEKWEIPFLGKTEKTNEQWIDYFRCMTITQNVPDEVYYALPQEIINLITNYIDAPRTATTFSKDRRPPSREIITSEVIYYSMVAFQIPFECQKWHLNRLITLIRVCNIKNSPPKKYNKRELMSRNRALNAARRQSMNTTG